MAAEFEGKVAFVTGAGSGIGREVAIGFGERKAKVMVTDISEKLGQETVGLITQKGGEARFMACDVTNPAQCRAAVEGAVTAYGRLDCAFNNAGIMGPRMHVHEYSEADFEQVVRIHLFGVFYCLKYELIQMQKQGGGAIVNTSSVAGLTKAAAVDNGLTNIRVNAVCPGVIDTALTQAAFGDKLAERTALVHPIQRVGKPQEVAAAVIWLCSDAASLVTGIAMPVDGGWTATM